MVVWRSSNHESLKWPCYPPISGQLLFTLPNCRRKWNPRRKEHSALSLAKKCYGRMSTVGCGMSIVGCGCHQSDQRLLTALVAWEEVIADWERSFQQWHHNSKRLEWKIIKSWKAFFFLGLAANVIHEVNTWTKDDGLNTAQKMHGEAWSWRCWRWNMTERNAVWSSSGNTSWLSKWICRGGTICWWPRGVEHVGWCNFYEFHSLI